MNFRNFIVVLCVFIFANPVFAALEIKGNVPEIPPIQSAPVGISPNINDNIQRTDEVIKLENNSNIAEPNTEESLKISEDFKTEQEGVRSSNVWIWWFVIFLGFLILAIWIKKNKARL